MTNPLFKAALLAGVLAVPLFAQAGDDKNAAKAQVRQVQQEKRRLEQEKGQLELDKAALDTQLKDAKATADSAKKTADTFNRHSATLQHELEQARSDNAVLENKISVLEKKLENAVNEVAATTEQRRATEVAKMETDNTLGQRDQALQNCMAKNREQYKVGMEMLERYKSKSCLSSMLDSEPFLGFAQTRNENELDAYRDRIEKQRLEAGK